MRPEGRIETTLPLSSLAPSAGPQAASPPPHTAPARSCTASQPPYTPPQTRSAPAVWPTAPPPCAEGAQGSPAGAASCTQRRCGTCTVLSSCLRTRRRRGGPVVFCGCCGCCGGGGGGEARSESRGSEHLCGCVLPCTVVVLLPAVTAQIGTRAGGIEEWPGCRCLRPSRRRKRTESTSSLDGWGPCAGLRRRNDGQ